MNEETQKRLRLAGIFLLIFANACLTLLGDTSAPERIRVLTDECENYLMNSDEFQAPPSNCIQEMEFLLKRLNNKLKE